MTAPTATRTPLRERLETLTDYMITGAWLPDGCTACGPVAWCEECVQSETDRESLGKIMAAVGSAVTDREALNALVTGLLELAGVSEMSLRLSKHLAHAARHAADPDEAERLTREADLALTRKAAAMAAVIDGEDLAAIAAEGGK